MSAAPNQIGVSGGALLYENPVPLKYVDHKDLGLSNAANNYSFARGAHMVPLVAAEMPSIVSAYPIVFVGDERMPVAALGINANNNVYLDSQGQWMPGRHIPSYIQRHPFILARDSASDRMVLCIDQNASRLTSVNADVPLFSGESLSAYAENALALCEWYEQGLAATRVMIGILREFDLFCMKTISYVDPEDNVKKRVQFVGIDDAKFGALSGEDKIKLHDSGAINIVYAHLFSLANWNYLVELATGRPPVV